MKQTFAAVTALALASISMAQDSQFIYRPGRSIADQKITLQSWGSGTVAETDEAAYEGTTSVRIATRNFFQGGIMKFENPVDLSDDFADKNNLLRLAFKIVDSSSNPGNANPATPGRPGGPQRPGAAPGGRPGLGDILGRGGAGGQRNPNGEEEDEGQAPANGGRPTAAQPAPPVRRLRYIVTTTDGKKSEAYVPIPMSVGDRGWRTVSIPLNAIRGFEQTNKQIQNISLSADTTAIFYVGEMRIINDSTPIRGEANVQRMNLAQGDEVQLSAYGFGGSSILKYTWDFDVADGIQIDAEGQTIRRKFRKPGTYTITLTISDRYGLKSPYQTMITATVNP